MTSNAAIVGDSATQRCVKTFYGLDYTRVPIKAEIANSYKINDGLVVLNSEDFLEYSQMLVYTLSHAITNSRANQ